MVKTGHRTMDWFKIGKEVQQGCVLSPCLFNFYAEYIMQNASPPIHTVPTGVIEPRILQWFVIPFSRGQCFVRTLHHDLSVLCGPA